ncbi:lipase 1-like [Drosophila sulfurigaster albostrigata]|uniref:lipase 1-like n=1 Tax=Drosophila sulfurigaster albostrigata TaxID=89887 RepID=UPI002D21BEFA|nr:lipase 1-like [Drosophila sulfurigaster albostrigata]XP_062141907.1 lipase 1-like [Drosophila sulfurigaster albostrigata]XP_062141909.1 lipase 1-like [Drosophila sulfurigaster albostrigata]XP_062141910.1 lipase 1-like [Drosophila sulfurigaster albostrigata]XP_062141913.1 lipase 1-like [Drosophila sulfurigaster albostrigata]XP_062141915.1 lipase 1-like [Drosophila sulfurigaster albostrigata]
MWGKYIVLIWLSLQANFVYSDKLHYNSSVLEDAKLTTPELIEKYGYKVETHVIQTDDGYRLTIHRIPKHGARPVLLVHGLGDSSAAWVLTGPGCGLAYLLSDRGYDIWLMNIRGNRYSRKHIRYATSDRQFWDFSFHEHGVYDIPAVIDYILPISDHRQVHYIGHSQGTSAVFAMGADRPSYMKKIKLLQALAPVAYFENLRSPIIRLIKPYAKILIKLARIFGIYEFPPNRKAWRRMFYKLCTSTLRNTCKQVLMKVMGLDGPQFNDTLTPLIFSHFFYSASLKALEHYQQLLNSDGFYKFNYSKRSDNIKKYGTKYPPEYNVKNINCKVALYYGKNDRLSSYKDVQNLRKKLPNVVHDELLAYSKFSHLDFLVAIDAKKLLYDSMFRVMEKVDKGEL